MPTANPALTHSITGETRALLKLGGPLILTSLVNMGMSITDVIMIGWLGPVSLAAGAAASDFYSLVFYPCAGVIAALAVQIAQARGRDDQAAITANAHSALLIAVLMAMPGIALIFFSPSILGLIGVADNVVTTSTGYARWMSATFGTMLLVIICNQFLGSHGLTRIIFRSTLFILPFNGVMNYLLMFGKGPFPAMDLAGAGLSSWLSSLLLLAILLQHIYQRDDFKRYALFEKFSPNRRDCRELLRVGVPIGLSNLGEMGVFMASTLLMGTLGALPLAAHAIAMRSGGVCYAFPAGLGHACMIRVGLAAGRGDNNAILLSQRSGMIIGTLCGLLLAGLLWWQHPAIIGLFLGDSVQSNSYGETARLATAFILIMAFMMPFDAIFTTCSGALRGLKDTRIPMLITLFGYWLIGGGGSLIGLYWLNLGGLGVWLSLAIAQLFVAAGLWWRWLVVKRKLIA
jgi:MATE family multidrug resistance protein